MKTETQGYKFEDAHIRLGSKIHLQNFYYSEKLFVNSYYATKFAYIIFQYIKDNLHNWLNDRENKTEVVLLGYGTYSELLLSNLRSFLETFYKAGSYKFEATTIEDAEGLRVEDEGIIRNAQNVILIIPIGATLTTSTKIRRKLSEYDNKPAIIGTPVTCIVVAPKENKEIQKKFWQAINSEERVITLIDGTNEKYFVFLESDWSEPHSCAKCFPLKDDDNSRDWLKNEKPLFETNKVSVIPSAIFSLPVSKHAARHDCYDKSAITIKYLEKDSIVPTHHIVRGSNHFLYYIDTDNFYKKNKSEIREWLHGLRQRFGEINKPVVLIAPEHNTDVEFANDVNEIIFGGTGTLIHQDPGDDFKTNFSLFYSHLFQNNPMVIFVDDAVCTGNTLNLLRELVMGGYNFDQERIKVISMIDRAAYWFNRTEDFEMYSLLSINLPPTRGEKLCFLCTEVKKYSEIIDKYTSDLNVDVLFRKKKAKLEKKDYYPDLISQSFTDRTDTQERYLRRIEFTNCLPIILDQTIQEGEELEHGIDFVEAELMKYLCKKFSIDKKAVGKSVIEDMFAHVPLKERMNMLKVIAYPYFSLYKNIRPIACKLVLNEILVLMNVIVGDSSADNIKYLLVLLKTVGKLNLNIILRSEIISETITIIDALPSSIEAQMQKVKRTKAELNKARKSEEKASQLTLERQMENIRLRNLEMEESFLKEKRWKEYISLCYVAAVKEVIFNDEAKSFRLECELGETAGSNLRDLLIFENTTVFIEALNRIDKGLRSNSNQFESIISQIKSLANRPGQFDDFFVNVHSVLAGDATSEIGINSDYRFEYFRLILHAIDSNSYKLSNNKNITLNVSDYPTYKSFLSVLTLKLFLEIHRDTAELIQDKMTFISHLIKETAGADGCFITVRRYNVEKFEDSPPVVIGTTERSFADKEIDKNWLTFRHWADLLGDDPGRYQTINRTTDNLGVFSEPDIIKTRIEIRSLCTIGIVDIDVVNGKNENETTEVKTKPYGLITLYSHREDAFPWQQLRMLTLIKQDLIGFLKKNYENDSFVEWMEEQGRKNLLMAMGHGFETYLSYLKEIMQDGTVDINEELKRKFEIYHSMLFNRIRYSRIFRHLQGNANIEDILSANHFIKEEINLKFFLESEIERVVKMIYEDSKIQQSYSIEPEVNCGDWNVFFYKELLGDVVFECVVNAKNHIDKNKTQLELKIKVTRNDNNFELGIEDNGTGIDSNELSKLKKKGYLKPEGGLSMIAILWGKLFNQRLEFDSAKGEYFKVLIPFRSEQE